LDGIRPLVNITPAQPPKARLGVAASPQVRTVVRTIRASLGLLNE
jgi:hypothetical protein